MPKKSKSPFIRICANCLADALVREAKSAKVVYWQDNHKCDNCTRRNIGVFSAQVYDPMERILNGATVDPKNLFAQKP